MAKHASEHDQFIQLLNEHQGQIYGYIVALTHNFADADDVFQLTSMVIWRKFHEFQRERSFLRWACSIARLETLDFLQAKRRRPLLVGEELQLELASIQSETDSSVAEQRRAALARCLEKMSPQNRQLLETCYSGEGSVGQASADLGRSKNSIYNSLRRIRGTLLSCVRSEIAREGMA
jgi:RNA polymerase sigma-70 factor (ECF subfamily)